MLHPLGCCLDLNILSTPWLTVPSVLQFGPRRMHRSPRPLSIIPQCWRVLIVNTGSTNIKIVIFKSLSLKHQKPTICSPISLYPMQIRAVNPTGSIPNLHMRGPTQTPDSPHCRTSQRNAYLNCTQHLLLAASFVKTH